MGITHGGDDLDMFLWIRLPRLERRVGLFLNRILDYIINLVTTYQLNMVKRMVGMVMLLAGQQYYHLRLFDEKILFYLTGMR